nr:MFS transporter [Lysinibacillus timonensis]
MGKLKNRLTEQANMVNDGHHYTTEEVQRIYKRTLFIVILSQTFGGAGLAAGITVGALLAQDMMGTNSVAGLPVFLFTLGSALSSFLVGHYSQKFGRRYGLSAGFITGGIGALGVILAANTQNIFLLFLALFIYGAGTSTNLQARYAGSDLANAKQRATAVSIALVATTFGAVAGPNLVTPMGTLATSLGMHPLSGPFMLAAAAFILAGLIFFIFLKPDPLLVAKEISRNKRDLSASDHPNQMLPSVNKIGIITGASILILTQFVMTSIMTMTPVHIASGHDHSNLSAVGMVIGFHVAAMFLTSPITGYLTDKYGRIMMVTASGITLALSGILAAITPGDSIFMVTIALVLLGLGWNFGLISATTIIIDSTTIETRAKIQGSVDVAVAITGSIAGLLSGVIVAYTSFTILGYLGTFMALLLIPLILWSQTKNKINAYTKVR